jgi:hypothetical protein
MRALADADRIRKFMQALAVDAREEGRVYFTGGATAVLSGWRPSTIDVDLKLVPEQDALLRAIPRLLDRYIDDLDKGHAGIDHGAFGGCSSHSTFTITQRPFHLARCR